jgi:hypothetical protein
MHDRRLTLPSPVLRRSTRYERRGASSAGVAQLAEHLFCKQVVGGSSPPASSISFGVTSEGCPSGQREQAVNLPAQVYVGSNPTPSTSSVRSWMAVEVWRLAGVVGRQRRPVGSGSVALGLARRFPLVSRPRRPRRLLALGLAAFADRDLVCQGPMGLGGRRLRAAAGVSTVGCLAAGSCGSGAETFGGNGALNVVRRLAVSGGKGAVLPLRSSRGSSSIGRASAFQAERRGFEPLLPLQVSAATRKDLNGAFSQKCVSPLRCWSEVQHLNGRIGWPT